MGEIRGERQPVLVDDTARFIALLHAGSTAQPGGVPGIGEVVAGAGSFLDEKATCALIEAHSRHFDGSEGSAKAAFWTVRQAGLNMLRGAGAEVVGPAIARLLRLAGAAEVEEIASVAGFSIDELEKELTDNLTGAEPRRKSAGLVLGLICGQLLRDSPDKLR